MRREQLVRMFAVVSGCLGVAAACTSTSTNGTMEPGGVDASTEAEPPGAADSAAAADADAGSTATPDAATALDASVTGDADAAAAEADAGEEEDADAGDRCNDLAQLGSPVQSLRAVGGASFVDFDGGTIPDGTYVLTNVTDHVEVPPGGTLSPYGTETLRITGSMLEEVFTYPAGDVRRFTSMLTAEGARLQMTTICVFSSIPGKHLPQLGDWFPFEHAEMMTSFDATDGTLTLWTPRGNHESLVLVYAKLIE